MYNNNHINIEYWSESLEQLLRDHKNTTYEQSVQNFVQAIKPLLANPNSISTMLGKIVI